MRRMSFILAALMVMLSVACERKVLLEPDHGHGVGISVSINATIEVDTEVEKGDDPNLYSDILASANSVTIVAYPLSETAVYGVHKIKGLSGVIWLRPGEYNLLIYTSDFYDIDGVHYRNLEVSDEAEAYTTSVKSSKAPGVKSFNMEAPDPLFTD